VNPTTRGILAELRESLERTYGEQLVKLILFGSQAREDAAAESDIDVLVVLHGPVRAGEEIARVGETTSELSLKYDVVISCMFVSEERYSTEQSPLLLNVRREGVAA
jgi:predicted nucleotidyltransferase